MLYDFLINHYQLIISCVTMVVSIIILIVKKRPIVDVFHYIALVLPEAIRLAENTSLKGQDKMFFALRQVIDLCKKGYNLTINHRDYSQIMLMIEDILNTPSKK